MRHWFLPLIPTLLLVALDAAAQVPAQQGPGQVPDPPREVRSGEQVVVWQAPDWAPLYSRIRGHTIDLNVRVFAAPEPAIPEDPSAQWRLSRRLCEQYAAELVVWFDPGAIREGRIVLRLALPRQQRLLERELGGLGEAGERAKVPSVALETAAVIVREALQALLMGEVIGTSGYGRFDDVTEFPERKPAAAGIAIEPAPRVNAPPPAPSAAAPAVTTGTQPNKPTSTPRTQASTWELGAGLQMVADGFGPMGSSEGLLARIAWRSATFELGAMASGNLPVNVPSDAGSVRLSRQQFGFIVSLPLSNAVLGISIGLRVGPTRYQRDRLTPSQEATARASATHWLGSAGPLLQLRYPAQNHRFSTDLAIGADVPSHRLEVGYRTASEFVVSKRSWPIQPYLQLGIRIGL